MERLWNENYNVTEIVLACLVHRGEGASVHKNRPSYGLAINCGGEKIYTFDSGETLSVKKGELIFFPKGSNYSIVVAAESDMYCINFQTSDNATPTPFVLRPKHTDEIFTAYQEAEKAWRLNKAGVQFKCKAELYKIFYALYKEYAQPYVPESKQSLLSPALEYIHKHYTEELINVEQLSRLCGISYEYFRRLFHQFYGDSPVKYINELKLKRAKELLSSGLYSVSDAALQSGFTDVSFFSRYFKKRVGVPPSLYP